MAASSRSRSAPPDTANETTAMVLYDGSPPVTCIGCGKTSAQVGWGQYKVTYTTDRLQVVARVPMGLGCSECRDLAYLAYLPVKKSWEELEKELPHDAKLRASWREWQARRGGKVARFPKQAVHETTRVGLRWEETFMPLPLNSDVLQGTDPHAIPGLRVDTIRDTNGKPTPVILTRDPNTPPKLIMYCETEANLLEHHLTQEQQLRATQGAEWWAHLMEKTYSPGQHPLRQPATKWPTWCARPTAGTPNRQQHIQRQPPMESSMRQTRRRGWWRNSRAPATKRILAESQGHQVPQLPTMSPLPGAPAPLGQGLSHHLEDLPGADADCEPSALTQRILQHAAPRRAAPPDTKRLSLNSMC